MIEAVSRIGGYVQQVNGGEDLLTTFIENPNSNGKYKFVLIVVLNEQNGDYSFSHVEYQVFKDFENYLYKRGYSAATDATPTSRITEIDKTFENKFLRWFQKCDSNDLSEKDKEELKRMSIAINNKSETILAELKDKLSLKKSDEYAIITLGIKNNGEIKYLRDIPVFRNILLLKGKDKYITKKSQGTSLGKEALCSVCKERKKEVYGFAIPWAFHTFDKPGFIAGGFEVSESWKNTPVCFDCATRLELGKKYIEERLDFSFYGFRYLLVPKLALGGDFQYILRILGGKNQKRKQNLSGDVRKSITSDEDEILDLVQEMEDFISNSLIFYKKEQSSYRILLMIEGVLPSRLRYLFKVKSCVDERFKIYSDLLLSEAQREKIRLEFNFGVVRRFFPQESKNRTFDKIFLEIVNKTFVGDPIDYNLIINFIMRRVRDEFLKGHQTKIVILNGFLLLHYLAELNLFRNYKEDTEEMDGKSGLKSFENLEGLTMDLKVVRFFEANKPFFTSDAKKATFLEGVLAQKLLNIQWRDKNATPFRTKLHGLKMNEALIKRLLPEIQNKLEEYGKNYYRDLESIIAQHFILAGVNWIETDDELSFYFVLGMDMQKLFKNERENEEQIGEEA
ncbi:MAG TPA: TIGR02556 family CRISPR-associated protein [Methanothrix sp.]|jgi:CRISPR-associated protein Csh1|nr:MAG: CRISPR-associated protein (cas_TM1802) [Methanosaeta sp. PtaB.Bin087]HPY71995.1 TIGR02556 family CRISPR-associated protein [Methanothrix sp.]HQA61652.1 TIGR02556 family CRISPR-associated protein [Methanothrix sp.]